MLKFNAALDRPLQESRSEFMPPQPKQMDMLLNDFAVRSFRDMADGDYIAARMALRAGLMHQFLWSSQQAIEKYLKGILLFNRIPAKVGHDIEKAMELTKRLPFPIQKRPQSEKFIKHIATYGEYRYLDVSTYLHGYALLDLDMTVWDLRRYCQVLRMPGGNPTPTEARMFEMTLEHIESSSNLPPQDFRIANGWLETVIAKKSHPARALLLWQNGLFGARRRNAVRVTDQMQMTNAPLWLHPEMVEELLKYVFIPKDLAAGYREHLANIIRDPTTRP